jgi:integrase
MKTDKFPLTVEAAGVTAKIYRGTQTHGGIKYRGFIVAYSLLGKRKQVWRSDIEDAKATARDACVKIANGEQQVLQLTNSHRLTYLRACDHLKAPNVPLDTACREYSEAATLLNGRASIVEVARDWLKRNATELPRILMANAAAECLQQAETDRKSQCRREQLSAVFDRLGSDLNIEVHTVTPDIVSRWLSSLPFAERTRANYRDVVGFLCRFCVRRGYLTKGTDWLENVQRYKKRKTGAISIYAPAEITTLLRYAEKHAQAMVPFLAIGAFAGLRSSEIDRLDWRHVDLADGFLEVLPVDGTKSEERRRLVPIKPNLKAWLSPRKKDSGAVCPYANSAKQLVKLGTSACVEWAKNALRHSCISYHVAECADVPRVADECGNSPQIIRTNYLRRVRPAQAAEWFGIMPSEIRQC